MPVALDPRRLAAARLAAASSLPYLASALFALPVDAAAGSGTVGISRRWRLAVDPALLERWPAGEMGKVFNHLLSHVLRDHAARAEALGVEGRTARAWLLAADAEVNDDLCPCGSLPEAAPDLPGAIGGAEGRLAEEYLDLAAGRLRRAVLDCGSGADGVARPWEDDDADEAGDVARRLARRRVAEDVRRALAEQPGSVPAGWARWAEDVLAPRADWRRELAAQVRRAVASVAGAVDYTYRRPSRRAPRGSRVLLPSLYRPLPEVAVVCDTSGSMNETLLAQSLAEVDGILAAIGMRRGARVLACDSAVRSVTRVLRADQLRLAGGGGTDMAAGIRAALGLRPPAGIVVVLTDGQTGWPAQAPRGARLVVALLRDGSDERTPVPSWVRAVAVRAPLLA